MRSNLLLLLLLCIATFAPSPSASAEVTDEQVEQTIAAMKRFLYSRQLEDGSWAEVQSIHRGGVTAMVVHALLLAGDSPQTPALARAIRWLELVQRDDPGIYFLSYRAHLWAQLPDAYMSRLLADAGAIQANAMAHRDRLFRYTRAHTNMPDMSVAQYAMLALWEAAKRGVAIPGAIGRTNLDFVINMQLDDGGWGYKRGLPATGSMTCAGLTVLYVIQQQFQRDFRSPDEVLALAIERGLNWMDSNFRIDRNPFIEGNRNWYYYYLYSVERVGLAGGIRTFGGVDWYRLGAEVIVNKAMDTGSVPAEHGLEEIPEINTAFALAFLSRGRYPVMMLKLRVPETRWNQHPMDLAFLAQHLSDTREAEMNWQVVDVDSRPDDWIDSPILFIASPDGLRLTDRQQANIKRYIDIGGTVVFSPDDASRAFLDSVGPIVRRWYPHLNLRPLEADDPIFETRDPTHREAIGNVKVVSNGIRNLVYIADTDWSYEFQSGRDEGKSEPWRIMADIWASATNRGKLTGRLAQYAVRRHHRDFRDEVTVTRVRYEGDWDPEPFAWRVVANHVWNGAGVDVSVETRDIAELADSSAPLAYIEGIEPPRFGATRYNELVSFVRNGGTLFVENIGGGGEFSRALSRELGARLGVTPGPLPASHPIITGRGLPGGVDNANASYRRYAALQLSRSRPVLSSIMLNGRPAVIFAHEDVSLAALGTRHWHILGYETESARNLLMNLSLWAAQR